MKTAIVCDWLATPGGAEKVIGQIINCYPDADIFAVIDFVDQEHRDFLHNKSVTTTFIQKLPFAKTKYRSYLPFMPLAIEQLDVTGYDLVISSSHAVAKGVITGPDQVHISYVHSPMRYAWDLQFQYLRETGLDKKWRGWLARYFLHKLRMWDLRSASGVDHFIANSQFIARRIQKIYRREATVIYPPIDTDTFKPGFGKQEFYLTASRLVPYKKIDLIVEAFQQLPDKKLVVIGDGPEMEKIKNKAGCNVEIAGYQSNEILIAHMQQAKAFIFAAEEDFGLLPVEAQACGTPVIAYGKGGALETVRGISRSQPTGIFFDEQTAPAIVQAVKTFEYQPELFTQEACVQNAVQFHPENFRRELKKYVADKCKDIIAHDHYTHLENLVTE
ncbi:MAG TPA: glycosyltransferase family 4 protein [Gammaproteobacteria bacterium]|nr:glycosyltransferase family 4 protein [Gammaproteobacteria bacterium]